MEGSDLVATIGRGVANVPWEVILDILMDEKKSSQWDKLFKTGKVIETLGHLTGCMNHSLIFHKHKVTGRGVVQRVQGCVPNHRARLC